MIGFLRHALTLSETGLMSFFLLLCSSFNHILTRRHFPLCALTQMQIQLKKKNQTFNVLFYRLNNLHWKEEGSNFRKKPTKCCRRPFSTTWNTAVFQHSGPLLPCVCVSVCVCVCAGYDFLVHAQLGSARPLPPHDISHYSLQQHFIYCFCNLGWTLHRGNL